MKGEFMDFLPLLFWFFFLGAGAWILYTQGRSAKILLTIFWSFWLCISGYSLFESFLLNSLDGLNLRDLLILPFALTLCVLGLVSLILHKKFPNLWLFYPYACFFIVIVLYNALWLFGNATYVDDENYLWFIDVAFLVVLGIAGLYTLFKRRKLVCTLIFVAICLPRLWSLFHFST